MAGFLDEALAFYPSRSASRRREPVCIFPDDASNTTCSMKPSLSTKPTVRNTIPKSPAYMRTQSPRAQVVRHRAPKILAASTRKAPLQRNSNPPQARALAVDIPGRGGGKENIPPGMSAHFNVKSKPIGRPLLYQTTRRTERNVTPTKSIQLQSGEAREDPIIQTVITEARGNHSNFSKPQLQNTLALNTQASNWPKLRASLQSHKDLQSSYIKTILIELVRQYWMLVGNVEERRQLGRSALISLLKGPCVFSTCLSIESIAPAPTALSSRVLHAPRRDQSAVIIQRAWRSYMERRNEHECAIAKVKTEWAKGVIARWWRGIKPSQKQEKTPKRKPAARRSAGHQSRGRVGIRRL